MFIQPVRLAALLVAGLVAGAWAQAPENIDNEIERGRSLWNPPAMMKQACDGISKHYKLDAKQRDSTCKLLTERVTKFLGKHERQLWPLLMELTEQQIMGKEPSKETAQRISSSGYPIFEEARAEILKAQDEFRKLLNEEQKKIHDRDLKGLNAQFRVIDRRFQNWREGKVDGRHPLQNIGMTGGRQIVPDPTDRRHRNRNTPESAWEKYVREFVVKYRLDGAQKATAMAILQDLKDQAGSYRRTHHKDLVDAEAYVRQAQLAKPFDKKALVQAQQIRLLLNKPFEDWFGELKSRLEQLPTEKQRADFYVRNPHLKPEKPDTQTAKEVTKPDDQPAKPTESATKPQTKKAPVAKKPAEQKKEDKPSDKPATP